jgi:hypothetical protein
MSQLHRAHPVVRDPMQVYDGADFDFLFMAILLSAVIAVI